MLVYVFVSLNAVDLCVCVCVCVCVCHCWLCLCVKPVGAAVDYRAVQTRKQTQALLIFWLETVKGEQEKNICALCLLFPFE